MAIGSVSQGHHRAASIVAALEGRWLNQHGSELVLDPWPDGSLHGTYRTASGIGSDSSAPVRGAWEPGDLGHSAVVGFIVSWPAVRGLTTWCGRYRPAEGTIEAGWVMCTEAEDPDDWRSTFTGHDVFHRA